MPYADSSFAFAYGINILHHITDGEARQEFFREITRVLKPGGLFFLHEINTENLLFRFYMGYVFPLVKDIDEGTETWVMPMALPELRDASWTDNLVYFNFLPDFTPTFLLKMFSRMESRLEKSRMRRWSIFPPGRCNTLGVM